MKSTFSKFLKRFKDDETATLTVEFILITPVLMTWFIGSIVFFNAFITKGAAQSAAITISDVVSRKSTISNDDIDKLLVLQNRMLPSAGVGSVAISSIQKNFATGDLELLWTYSTEIGGTDLVLADVPATALPNMQNGESVLLVDTSVPFTPIADWIGIVATNWTNRIVVTTRFVDPLNNTDFP